MEILVILKISLLALKCVKFLPEFYENDMIGCNTLKINVDQILFMTFTPYVILYGIRFAFALNPSFFKYFSKVLRNQKKSNLLSLYLRIKE